MKWSRILIGLHGTFLLHLSSSNIGFLITYLFILLVSHPTAPLHLNCQKQAMTLSLQNNAAWVVLVRELSCCSLETKLRTHSLYLKTKSCSQPSALERIKLTTRAELHLWHSPSAVYVLTEKDQDHSDTGRNEGDDYKCNYFCSVLMQNTFKEKKDHR